MDKNLKVVNTKFDEIGEREIAKSLRQNPELFYLPDLSGMTIGDLRIVPSDLDFMQPDTRYIIVGFLKLVSLSNSYYTISPIQDWGGINTKIPVFGAASDTGWPIMPSERQYLFVIRKPASGCMDINQVRNHCRGGATPIEVELVRAPQWQ